MRPSPAALLLVCLQLLAMSPAVIAFLRVSGGLGTRRAPLAATRVATARRAAGAHTMAASDSKIGFIGLGYMGVGMVRRLLGNGEDVVVWNRTPAKSAQLQAEFDAGRVTVATSAQEVVEACGRTFSMLSTPAAAREVFYAPDGVLAGMGPGKALVDCATLEEADMQEFDQAVKAKGGRFLEAPVSGSKVPAEQGQLIFLAAGDEALFKEAGPQLEVMGKASFFLGDTGKGTRMKLVVNMVMGIMMAALGEGMTLADRSGLSKDDLVKILSLGAMANPMFSLKGPKIIADDHTPNFPLKHAQKDLAFALTLASQLGVDTKTGAAANEFYVQSLAAGDGELDFSAVARAVDAAAKAK